MAEHLEQLLRKIQDEAVGKADIEAQKRLTAADVRAKEIEAEATRRAHAIVAAAEAKAAQFADNGRKSLDQAARDMLIYLRLAITKYFEVLVRQSVPEIIPAKVIQDILVILATKAPEAEDVCVYVSEKDSANLVEFFLHRFREQVKKGVELHPMKGIKAGFRISMTNKDVVYDFSDDVLVTMLSGLVNPTLEGILKSSAAKK